MNCPLCKTKASNDKELLKHTKRRHHLHYQVVALGHRYTVVRVNDTLLCPVQSLEAEPCLTSKGERTAYADSGSLLKHLQKVHQANDSKCTAVEDGQASGNSSSASTPSVPATSIPSSRAPSPFPSAPPSPSFSLRGSPSIRGASGRFGDDMRGRSPAVPYRLPRLDSRSRPVTPARGPVIDLGDDFDFSEPMQVDVATDPPIAPLQSTIVPASVAPPVVPTPVAAPVAGPIQPDSSDELIPPASVPPPPGLHTEIWGPFNPSSIEAEPHLMRFDLAYHSQLDALMCTSCRTVVSAHHLSIHQHLKAHGVSQAGQREAVALTEDCYPSARKSMPSGQEFGTSQSPSAPFEGFELHRNGFGCSVCMYAAVSDKAVHAHMRREHGSGRLLEEVTWQRLGRGNDTAGFRVKLPIVSNRHCAPTHSFMDEFDAFDPIALLGKTRSLNAREINPLLTEARWHDYTHGKDPLRLREQVQIEKRRKNVPDALYNGIEWLFSDAMKRVDDTSPVALCVLKTAKARATEVVDAKPFSVHKQSKTTESYVGVVRHLLTFMLYEPPNGDWSNYLRPPTSHTLSAALTRLRSALADQSSTGSRSSLTTAITQVLRALWFERWNPTRSNPFVDPTMCFIAIYFLKPDGAFETASGVPTVLTRLVYFMRCLVLLDAHKSASSPTDVLEQLNRLHVHIEEGQESTFAAVWRLQAYAKFISMSSIGLPRVWYTEKGRKHFTELHYKSHRFSLAGYAQWNLQLQQNVLSSLTELGVDKEIAIAFNSGLTGDGNLLDDAECNDVYYSVFTELENQSAWKDRSRALLRKLLKTPGFLNVEGRPILTRWMRWFNDAAEGEKNLMLLTLNNEGSPSRATEHVNMLVANTPTRQRNLVHMSPHLCVAAQYSKSTAVTGTDKSILKGLDAFTSWALFQYHVLVRPIQVYMAQFMFPSTASTVIHQLKTMLFMDNGKPFTATRLTVHMESTSLEIFNWGITPNPHRHIQTALHRDLVPKVAEVLGDSEYRMMSALQAGHSLQTEETVYGLPGGTITGDSQAVAEAYITVSKAWQQATGILPSGSPVVYGDSALVNWVDPATRTADPIQPPQQPTQVASSSDPVMLQMLQSLLDRSQSTNAKLDAQATEIALLRGQVASLIPDRVAAPMTSRVAVPTPSRVASLNPSPNMTLPMSPPPADPLPELFKESSYSPQPKSRHSHSFSAPTTQNPVDIIMDEDEGPAAIDYDDPMTEVMAVPSPERPISPDSESDALTLFTAHPDNLEEYEINMDGLITWTEDGRLAVVSGILLVKS
ncbi:hypothetical protein CYLTODRAFT_460180 [Cylindrobasidium torrendii FP15055 ss-10]|uniref:C2H2-type domain-containing protein n=1 Tax=Cylindrobasidium torrendii FP15055 ss-10 TaxID=1314674 RepID=A0A0D7AS48_9AGAR|nr:hypothetical protein CYLTODRAFT_460180 [Cylindrobasidium torrendii FP15055 ss-10]